MMKTSWCWLSFVPRRRRRRRRSVVVVEVGLAEKGQVCCGVIFLGKIREMLSLVLFLIDPFRPDK